MMHWRVTSVVRWCTWNTDDVAEQFSLLAAGFKSVCALQALLERNLVPSRVCTYPVRGESPDSDAMLREACRAANIVVIEKDQADDVITSDPLVFAIGWQYLVRQNPTNLVVLHDSLLPKYRGFSPSVTALVNGEVTHGVTALLAVDEADSGPVVAQEKLTLRYPMTIRQLFEALGPLYAECVSGSIDSAREGFTQLAKQNEDDATYSIWRDEADFRINWHDDAMKIARVVDALGFPYGGAVAMDDRRPIRVLRTIPITDVVFEDRHPGKLWKLHPDGSADVVCGTGMLRLQVCRDERGELIRFDKLRTRLS